MTSLEQEVAKLLREKGLSLGVIESASGGLLSHLITNVPGSSDYYQGSITAYSNQIKIKVVGVSQDTIRKYGAVSHEVAKEMARGGRRVLDSDICLAVTGIAGPGGASPGKTAGLFYLGLSYSAATESRKHTFPGDREQKKLAAAQAALAWLKEHLLSLG